MEIHNGSQQYHNTKVVTFVARFQLENRTPFKLAYLQRHLIADTKPEKVPCIMPRAVMAFHWPRADLDQLLCIRLVWDTLPMYPCHCTHTIPLYPCHCVYIMYCRVLELSDCQWSGGFPMEQDKSFHINMRYYYI